MSNSGGKVIGLGITTSEASSLVPQYQPISELGVPGYNVSNWWGVFVPKGTPQGVIDVLFKATNEVLADAGVQQSLANNYEEAKPSASVEEFARFARQEGEQGLRLAKASLETVN